MCRSCRKGRYAPPVHMIRLTETQEIAPYPWVDPDEDRYGGSRRLLTSPSSPIWHAARNRSGPISPRSNGLMKMPSEWSALKSIRGVIGARAAWDP